MSPRDWWGAVLVHTGAEAVSPRNWLEREWLGLPVWEWLAYAAGFVLGVVGFAGQLP